MDASKYLDMVENLNPKSVKYSEELAEVIYLLARMMNDSEHSLVDDIFNGTSPSILCTDYLIQSVSVVSNRRQHLNSWERWRSLCWATLSSRLPPSEAGAVWRSFLKE